MTQNRYPETAGKTESILPSLGRPVDLLARDFDRPWTGEHLGACLWCRSRRPPRAQPICNCRQKWTSGMIMVGEESYMARWRRPDLEEGRADRATAAKMLGITVRQSHALRWNIQETEELGGAMVRLREH